MQISGKVIFGEILEGKYEGVYEWSYMWIPIELSGAIFKGLSWGIKISTEKKTKQYASGKTTHNMFVTAHKNCTTLYHLGKCRILVNVIRVKAFRVLVTETCFMLLGKSTWQAWANFCCFFFFVSIPVVILVPEQLRSSWATEWVRNGRARNQTPSSTAGKRTLIWLSLARNPEATLPPVSEFPWNVLIGLCKILLLILLA